MAEQLLEIGLYFDERIDPTTQEKMDLQAVADHLIVYPLHLFKGRHDITVDPKIIQAHSLAYDTRGLLVLYSHLVSDPQIAYLQELKEQGYIKSWAVFPPGTWPQDYFQQKTTEAIVDEFPRVDESRKEKTLGIDTEDAAERAHEDWANDE